MRNEKENALQTSKTYCTQPFYHDNIAYKYVRKKMNKDTSNIQLQKALVPVSKMVIQFGLHCYEFKNNIQKAYVQAAIELLNETGITPTNQAIAVKTGLDRRAVAEIRKQIKPTEKSLNKMDLLLDEIQRQKNIRSNLISASKLNQVIDKIYGGHIRARAIIRELLSQDVLKQKGKHYLINQALHDYLSEQKELADEVDITTKRLFDTFYKKMYGQNQAKNLNLASVYSSKIPDSKHDDLNQIIADKMHAFQREMQQLITSYQTNVKTGTFANIGFAQFQFDSRQTSKLSSQTQ